MQHEVVPDSLLRDNRDTWWSQLTLHPSEIYVLWRYLWVYKTFAVLLYILSLVTTTNLQRGMSSNYDQNDGHLYDPRFTIC